MAKWLILPETVHAMIKDSKESFPGYTKVDIILESGERKNCRTVKGFSLMLRGDENFVLNDIHQLIFY